MYSFESRIRYSECDIDCYLTIESLIDYFQDCSTFQTQEGPATMEALAKDGIAWVLNSWQVVVHRLPKLGERVVTGTIPYELRGFLGLRNFFMRTEDGEDLAVANSVWSLINLEKGTPSRVTEAMAETYPVEERLDMDYAPRKLSMPGDAEIYDAAVKKVGIHHLDTNHHVNNGQYIRMALQACSQVAEKEKIDVLSAMALERQGIQIRAEYRQQAHLGDEIYPKVYVKRGAGEECLCAVSLNDAEGKAYAAVELKRI